jgi:hypothetical protein
LLRQERPQQRTDEAEGDRDEASAWVKLATSGTAGEAVDRLGDAAADAGDEQEDQESTRVMLRNQES